MTAIVQLITSFLGSLGFAILFHVPNKYLLSASFGGFVAWGIYLFAFSINSNVFVSCLFAALWCGCYAEVMARIRKTPALVYLVPCLIPLVPGSNLYYTIFGIASGDMEMAELNAKLTLDFALAIAIGIAVVWTITVLIRNVRKELHLTNYK